MPDFEEELRRALANKAQDAPKVLGLAYSARQRAGRRGSVRTGLLVTGVIAVVVPVGVTITDLAVEDERGVADHSPVLPDTTSSGVTPEVFVGTDAESAAPDSGEAAVWRVDESESLSPRSTSFTALVTRLECASGVTGEVLAPAVAYNATEIVVTFTVADNGGGGADCQGNDEVPWKVQLKEPLGERELVDGQCVPGTDANTTAFCLPTPVRHSPQER